VRVHLSAHEAEALVVHLRAEAEEARRRVDPAHFAAVMRTFERLARALRNDSLADRSRRLAEGGDAVALLPEAERAASMNRLFLDHARELN